jgi:TRAP-type transport system periplasmic protein
MTLNRALLPAVLLGILSALCGRADAAEQKWQCYTYLPAATDPAYQAFADFAAEISKASDGKLNVACHVGGSLPINASTIAQSIAENVLQLGLVDSLSYNSLVPAAGALSLPGLFPNSAALQNGIKALMPMLNAEFAKRNVVVLGIASYPLQVIYGTSKLTTLSDPCDDARTGRIRRPLRRHARHPRRT